MIKENNKTQKIVILGGGFAGVRAAIDLLNKNKNIFITLIDKNSYHSNHSDYYEIVAAIVKELREASISELVELRQTAAIPYSEIFKYFKNIEIIRDSVKKIDFTNSAVITEHKKICPYDWLIVSTGSETCFYEIPGLRDFSFELKTVYDAMNIRNRIDEIFMNAPKKEKISIVIGGGGFTGCEVAGEIKGYTNHLAALHKRPRENHEIIILEATDKILGGASDWARKKTENRFKKMGIKIKYGINIKEIGEKNFLFKDGGETIYNILIWTAGVQASSVSKLFPESAISKKSCLKTNKYLLVPSFKNIFAAGDIAYYENPKTKIPLPMTAQTAISQGKYIAAAITKKINKKKFSPYKPKMSKFIIPIGGKYAVADLGFIKFSGFFAWILKHFVILNYFINILPLYKAISLWIQGMKIYVKNDRISNS